jgi:predicted regulator of Ras-like GTPase activity (Roadblock/LC7/MglB family)
VGEDAFHDVASWPSGDFELHYDEVTEELTIQQNWSSLLLAALHTLDETPDARRQYYEAILSNLNTVPGVAEFLIASADGAVRAAEVEETAELEALWTAYARELAVFVGEECELGAFERLVLYGEGQPSVVLGFAEECYQFTLLNGADPEKVARDIRDLLRMVA